MREERGQRSERREQSDAREAPRCERSSLSLFLERREQSRCERSSSSRTSSSLSKLSLSRVALSPAASLAPAPRVALYLAASLVSLSLHPRVTLSPPTCHLINMPNPSFNATCTSKGALSARRCWCCAGRWWCGSRCCWRSTVC